MKKPSDIEVIAAAVGLAVGIAVWAVHDIIQIARYF